MLNKICLHWTGGNNYPCETDLNAYHYCAAKDGKIYQGKFTPEDNLNCKDGRYAKHLGGGNTGCIGISLCGMRGFNPKTKETDRPITEKQVESFCCLAAYLSVKYNIQTDKNTVFTHYEFDQKQTKQKGKTDITFISYLPNLQKERVGDYLRNKIAWYKIKIRENKYKLEKKGNCYEFICIH